MSTTSASTCTTNTWGPSFEDPAARWQSYLTQPYGLVWHRDFARAHGKPMTFPEWGVITRADGHGGGDAPYFIQRMHDWIGSNDVAYHIYFEFENGYEAGALTTGAFPNSAAVFRSLFGPQPPTPRTPGPPTPGSSLAPRMPDSSRTSAGRSRPRDRLRRTRTGAALAHRTREPARVTVTILAGSRGAERLELARGRRTYRRAGNALIPLSTLSPARRALAVRASSIGARITERSRDGIRTTWWRPSGAELAATRRLLAATRR